MSRRLEKINRTIRDTVSHVIQTQMSDPRIKGMVSVTRVEVAADLTVAKVYLSVLGVDEKKQQQTVNAIGNAAGFVQSFLAKTLTTRSCPILKFFLDSSLKTSMEVMELISKAASEFTENQPDDNATDDNSNQNDSDDQPGGQG